MKRWLVLGILGVAAAIVFHGSRLPLRASAADNGKGDNGDMDEAFAMNAACCVCHIPFLKEELSKQHLAKKYTCVKCHGVSAGHANDEDIGATKPDIVFKRHEVDGACIKCHKGHDVPPKKVIARLVERKLSPETTPICTDCHGHHKIEKQKAPK